MTETGNVKRLYRSRQERVFSGVCGGIAEYFGIDPVIVRLLWIFSAFAMVGIVFYLIAIFIIPENPHQSELKEKAKQAAQGQKSNWNFAIGAILVLLGGMMLLDQFHLWDHGWFRFHFFPWRLFWPLMLIGLGVYFVASGTTVRETTSGVKDWVNKNRLFKSRDEKIAFGVCGGLARHFDVDPTIVRLLVVAAFFLTAGVPVLIAYFIAAVILPFEDEIVEAHNNGAENGNS